VAATRGKSYSTELLLWCKMLPLRHHSARLVTADCVQVTAKCAFLLDHMVRRFKTKRTSYKLTVIKLDYLVLPVRLPISHIITPLFISFTPSLYLSTVLRGRSEDNCTYRRQTGLFVHIPRDNFTS
jgi:hypothetical protein